MTSVQVRVPEPEATDWEPWLTSAFGEQAEVFDLGYDGGESDGAFEVFDFEGEAAQVQRAAIEALKAHGIHRRVTRTMNVITVAGTRDDRWLVPMAPKSDAYEKALHRVAGEVSEDPELRKWLSGTQKTRIRFHESHGPGRPSVFPGADYEEEGEIYLMHRTDLSIVDGDPSKAEAEGVARRHIRDVLEAVAEHLQHPLP